MLKINFILKKEEIFKFVAKAIIAAGINNKRIIPTIRMESNEAIATSTDKPDLKNKDKIITNTTVRIARNIDIGIMLITNKAMTFNPQSTISFMFFHSGRSALLL